MKRLLFLRVSHDCVDYLKGLGHLLSYLLSVLATNRQYLSGNQSLGELACELASFLLICCCHIRFTLQVS